MLSVGGRVLGLKQFKVTNEKVSITKIEAEVVTDVNVVIEGYDASSGQVDPLVARMSYSNHFDSHKKVGHGEFSVPLFDTTCIFNTIRIFYTELFPVAQKLFNILWT